MGTAYTPGLKVSADATIEKIRRLPVKGEVLVDVGATVSPDTVVARALLPGDIEIVRLADRMGVDPDELTGNVRVRVGDEVRKGDLLAEVRGFFGLFKSQVASPCDGRVEYYTEVTGHLGIRKPPVPIEINAYVAGVVREVIAGEGVVVRTRGAFIQGIFGVGGERQGRIRMSCGSPGEELSPDRVPADARGAILVGGSSVGPEALKRAAAAGARAVVVGGITDRDLREYLGYDIGIAITGDENIPLTLILTEGFGRMPMARRTFELLRSQEGKAASVNGATQIRAGAMRPEIIVPAEGARDDDRAAPEGAGAGTLGIGTPVRAIREPYFGQIGEVVELPPQPVRIPTGAVVRVLRMRIGDGRVIEVPRANVEIVEL
ncbi:MAG: hypothetical protein N3A38_07255 [Planctomycetota bacterium]|nr:hypothetical protein [Planctomycetota bacterium]